MSANQRVTRVLSLPGSHTTELPGRAGRSEVQDNNSVVVELPYVEHVTGNGFNLREELGELADTQNTTKLCA